MYNHDFTSRGYLARAKENRAKGDLRFLFYAAFELRSGIEARLHEYLKGASSVATVHKGLWQIQRLRREVERVFTAYEKAVAVIFLHPETNEEIKYAYTPVTRELKNIGERMGDYLHYVQSDKRDHTSFEKEFAELIDSGIRGLDFATTGTLLGPPGGVGPHKNRLRLMFEGDSMPAFLKDGVVGTMKIRFKLISKSEKKFVVRFV